MDAEREIELRAREEATRARKTGIGYVAVLAVTFLLLTLSSVLTDLSLWVPAALGFATSAIFALFQAVSRLFSLVADLAARGSSQTSE